jgi:hypothetical protein
MKRLEAAGLITMSVVSGQFVIKRVALNTRQDSRME